MLYIVDGIEPNKEEAARYFKLSVDKDNTKSMLYYAFMLYEGEGISKNKEEAAQYYKLASDK